MWVQSSGQACQTDIGKQVDLALSQCEIVFSNQKEERHGTHRTHGVSLKL